MPFPQELHLEHASVSFDSESGSTAIVTGTTSLSTISDGKVRFSPVHHHIWLNPELDPWFSSGGFLEP